MDTPLRVLIVEDNPDDAELLIQELRRGGYTEAARRVDTAEAMKAALADAEWDVIIADYSMPGFTGLDALKIMQDQGLDLPFILVSGTVGEDIAVKAMKAGAHDYLMKGSLTRLVSAVGRELSQARERRERRQAEGTLRAVFESVMDGILVADMKTRKFVLANEGLCRMLGYDRKEILTLGVRDIHPLKDLPHVEEQFRRQARGEINLASNMPVMRKDGSVFYADINTTSVRLGNRACLVGVFRDITDRKNSEERERHLNAIIKAIRNVNQLITKEKDRYRLIRGACDNLVSTRGFNSAWIALMDGSGRFIYSAESGLGENFRQLKEMLEQSRLPRCIQKAMAREAVVITTDISIDCPDCPLSSIYKGKSSFCVRLEHGAKIYGTLTASVPCSFALDQEEQSLFQEVGEDIAFGLFQIEQEEKQRKMVNDLYYSEARYRALFEGAAEGILIDEIETRKFKYANPAICRMLGYTEDELKEMEVKDIHPPGALDRVYGDFDEHAGDGRGPAQGIPCLRKDGSIFYADFNAARTMIDGSLCNVGFVTDVTERKEINDALKASEERFKALFEFAPDAYYLHDLEGRFMDGNRAAEKLAGYSREEIIGKNFSELGLLDQEGLQKAAGLLQKSVQGLSTGPAELILKQKDGKQVFIEIRTFPISINGRDLVLGIARDISERKNLEQQLRQSQKLEAVGRLSGGVAHDFNNLLTLVIGNAEFILTDLPKDSPVRSGIEEILAAGERAATLTRQLLAFSRKQILQPKVINLNDIVREMEKMVRRMIREDIDLRAVLDPDLGQVEADPGQIGQVIMNLVVNAGDAMPGGGKITIETGNAELDEEYAHAHIAVTPGPYVMLSVSDTGMGMSREIQTKIFEPFFTTKEKGKGTGLGLSMVYGIVKQSSGNIWVYSEPGKGTTFKIYLPWVGKPASETLQKAKRTDTPTGSETILVVEDDEMVRNFTVRALKGYGYRVLTSSNGEDAVKVSSGHKGPIHLMLTDVIMPGISSREVETILKSSRPEMKVLFMSGYTGNTIVHHGVLDTGKAFIGKPFTPDLLGRKVREVLDRKT